MAYGITIEDAEEVELYRFGRSKQVFRGPRPDFEGPYLTFIGGSELFGKFVLDPFPRLVERSIGQTCVNLGTPGGGPGFFMKDPVILETCSNSSICVIQAMSVIPLSNRMYSVFPRRNMRLRKVSSVLKSLYPQLDFSKFRFVSSMIRTLKKLDPVAFKVVLAEQRSAWLARMLELVEDIETEKILLVIQSEEIRNVDSYPTKEMLDILSAHVDHSVRVTIPISENAAGNLSGLRKDTGWMTREAHSKIASAISRELQAMAQEKGPPEKAGL